MSYLPPNPYASLPPAFPPQGGLGGQQPGGFPPASPFGAPGGFPGVQADPMAALQGLQGGGAAGGFPGAQTDPMAALQGLQGGGFPGAAGMGQDTFAPQGVGAPQGAQPPAAQGQPQAGVFQHQSGGFADKNTSLSSGGGFWTSWKGISTIAGGLLSAVYAGFAIKNGSPFFWKWGKDFGSKAMNAAEGETKKTLEGFTDQIEKNYKTLKDGLTKENAEEKHGTFKKYVDEFWTDDLKKEFDEDSFKAYDAVREAHTKKADAIRDAIKEGKTPDYEAFKTEIDTAEKTYNDKLKKPATETETEEAIKAELAQPKKVMARFSSIKKELDNLSAVKTKDALDSAKTKLNPEVEKLTQLAESKIKTHPEAKQAPFTEALDKFKANYNTLWANEPPIKNETTKETKQLLNKLKSIFASHEAAK